MKKMRLDMLLVDRGLFPDADAALRAVLAREVRVNDVYATSAAMLVRPDAEVFVKPPRSARKAAKSLIAAPAQTSATGNADGLSGDSADAAREAALLTQHSYVSRGGYKLQGALDAFNQDVMSLRCIDIGSSTGGFTDCLLQAGAAQVTCVDVNYGQLAWQLREDPRTIVRERTNIRTAAPAELGAPFDLLVADLSFIGLAELAPVFARLCSPGSVLIALVKPQFESREGETDRGVVRDEAVRARTVDEVAAALETAGFQVSGTVQSPITGPKGNVEYLIRAVFAGEAQ